MRRGGRSSYVTAAHSSLVPLYLSLIAAEWALVLYVRRGLRRTLAVRESPQRGDEIRMDGQRLINFGSNDYLGLAADPRIAAAVREAIDQQGWGAGASPLACSCSPQNGWSAMNGTTTEAAPARVAAWTVPIPP